MATAQSVIKDFMNTLDHTSAKGSNALDEAVKAVSNFSSWGELKNKLVSDCAAYNGDWESFLADACGIILDNEDTGAISGSDAGGGSSKSAESIIAESGSWTYPSGTSFSSHGLTVKIPEQSSLNSSQQFIVGALYSWWIDSALDLISDSYGLSFYNSGVTVTEIDVKFYDKSDGKMAYVEYSTDQKCDVLNLKINMHYYNSIDTSDPNGNASGVITYLDRTIAHEMVHAVMAANIDYFSSLPTLFKEGSAELLHGIDDKRYSNIKTISASSSSLKSALNSTGANGYAAGYILLRYLAKQAAENRDPSVSIKNDENNNSGSENNSNSNSTSENNSSTNTEENNSSTENKTDETEKNSSTSKTENNNSSGNSSTKDSEASAAFSGKTLTVKGDFEKNIWLGGKDIVADTINNRYANENTITINAKQMTSSRVLAGNDNDNIIYSGSGGATLWGGEGGNDTLTGGSGGDVFWYALGNGNDVIKNFTAGKNSSCDVLAVSGELSSMTRQSGTISLTMSDGGNLSVNVGNEIDTAIKYSSELGTSSHQKVKVGNTSGENNFTYDKNVSYYFGGGDKNILTVSESAEIWLDSENYSNITEINAATSYGANILAGDSNSNTIIGGNGSTSLWGGSSSSDDFLQGGGGENIFWYGEGEGNDVISNSKSTDTLNLYNVQLADITSIEKNDSGFKIGILNGSLTVNGEMPTAKLSDGSSWTYDNESGIWNKS